MVAFQSPLACEVTTISIAFVPLPISFKIGVWNDTFPSATREASSIVAPSDWSSTSLFAPPFVTEAEASIR